MKTAKVLFLFSLVFLFLFCPFLQIGGVIFHAPYYLNASLTMVFLCLFLKNGVQLDWFHFCLVFLLGFIYFGFVSSFNSFVDMEILIDYFNSVLTLFAAYSIAFLFKKEFCAGKWVDFLYFSGVVHSIIMVVVFFSMDARDFIYDYVILSEMGKQFLDFMERSPGLTSAGGDGLSIAQAIFFLLGFYKFLFLRVGNSFWGYFLHSSCLLLLILSIFLSGRTGFLILGLGCLLIIVRQLFKGKNYFLLKSVIGKYLFLFCFFLILAGILVPSFMASDSRWFLMRSFEFLQNYIEFGQLRTDSTDVMQKMFFLPDSDDVLFWGDGNFSGQNRIGELDTDIGYVRLIFGAGMFGGGIMMFWLVILTSLLILNRARSNDLVFFVGVISLLVLFANFKVLHFASSRISFKVLALILSLMIFDKKGILGQEKSNNKINIGNIG